jgi:hypothetical protein
MAGIFDQHTPTIARRGKQHRQPVIRPVGDGQGNLQVTQEPVARGVERPLAALSLEHSLGIPEPREVDAFQMQVVDETVQYGIIDVTGGGGPEFGGNP